MSFSCKFPYLTYIQLSNRKIHNWVATWIKLWISTFFQKTKKKCFSGNSGLKRLTKIEKAWAGHLYNEILHSSLDINHTNIGS